MYYILQIYKIIFNFFAQKGKMKGKKILRVV